MDSWGRSACYPQGSFLSVERRQFHSLTAGSLTPTFVTARPVRLAVRLAFCVCTLRTISDRTELTFERLRYSLGRRPPQSNCPPDIVPRPVSRPQVRIPVSQGWYPNSDSTQTGVCASQSPTYPVHAIPKSNIKLQ